MQNTQTQIEFEPNWTMREFEFPQRTVRLATTFSGIGAIEHAFQRLNLKTEIVFAGDIDNNCKKAYFANYPISENRWHSDIHEFSALPYKNKVDLLVGGAPCQAFSMVGFRRGFEDTRGTLFREFARIIKECEPKVFIFENVKGLLNHNNGQSWETIANTFTEYCGYDIHIGVLNSKNFGIPQHRERLFCIGFKKAQDFTFPQPIPLKLKMYDFLEDWAGVPYYIKDKNIKLISTTKSSTTSFNEFIFPIKEVADKYYLSEKTAKYILAGGTKNFKTSTETDLEIARPLLQSMHKMHRAGVDNYVSYNKSKGINGLRKLTPRECLRLMGFNDSFKIVNSDTATYMEAGNSIVVDVLIAILKQLDITQFAEDNDQ